jgi:hypothetical protein
MQLQLRRSTCFKTAFCWQYLNLFAFARCLGANPE